MPITESMRVFRDACDLLAAVMTPHGFIYRKSKREVRRQGTLFEHFVTFGTSRSINSLPGNVHLEVRATTWSARLAEYRQQARIKLPYNGACLFSITVENIFRPAPPYVRYDVGDPKTRSDVLEHISGVLSTEVLRVFDLVESPNELGKAIDAGEIPCLDSKAIRDYIACFGTTL